MKSKKSKEGKLIFYNINKLNLKANKSYYFKIKK